MLTILHTNDLHALLSEEQASKLRAERERAQGDVLLLDAGDAIGAGNVTYRPGGEPILDRMRRAGYDAMAVGNREFHLTQVGFHAKVGGAGFPALSANVRSRHSRVRLPCVPSVSFTTDSVGRVIVFGLTVPMITEQMAVRRISAYVFDDPVETAARIVPEMRRDCTLLILLSHAGLKTDWRIAETAPGIDLIVGGHTHAELPHGEQVGNTLIVQAGSHARRFGRVAVTRDKTSWRLQADVQDL